MIAAASLLVALACVSGCGARTDLATSGAGGGATTSSASSSSVQATSSSVGGAPSSCGALVVLDPIGPLDTGVESMGAPDVALLSDGGVIVAGLDPSSSLLVGRTTPFAAWPPAPVADFLGFAFVSRFVLGAGVDGPVGYYNDDAGAFTLLQSVYPASSALALGTGAITPLFVAGTKGRFLMGASTPTPGYEVLDVSSYEPGGLPQKEEPLVCLTSAHRASAIPAGDGFLAALLSPNPPEPSCDPVAPKPGTVLRAGRYAPLGGPDLTFQVGFTSVAIEPFFHALLAPRADGAWLLEQLDGSLSRSPGPLVIRRLDAAAAELVPGGEGLALPGSQLLTDVAIASLGEDLAVAWVDAVDPSAPTVVVQVVRADLSLGPSTSFSTAKAWYFGALRMVASADGAKLFLAWDASGGGAPTLGAARVDCVGPL